MATVDSAWLVAAAADFSGDGRADILWRHPATGTTSLWVMNGPVRVSGAPVGVIDASWSVVGAADFTGDLRADILWRQTATGATSLWEMNGALKVSGGPVGMVDPSWSVVGVSDFTGDLRADILWRQPSTGAVTLWEMNGRTKAPEAWWRRCPGGRSRTASGWPARPGVRRRWPGLPAGPPVELREEPEGTGVARPGGGRSPEIPFGAREIPGLRGVEGVVGPGGG